MSNGQEILGPPISSRSEARPLVTQAVKHFREARRATIQVMADLRQLQDGQVHLVYGYRDFAKWAEDTFEGLSAGNVRQLTRAGAIALELDRRRLIDLRKPEGVGTTGLRELSVIANDFGNDKMIEIYLTARDMLEPGREVAGTTVKAAMALLMPPAKDEIVEAVPPMVDDDEEDDDGEDDDPDSKMPPKVRELIERIRDLAWDLPESAEELEHATKQLKAELAGADTGKDQSWMDSSR